MSKKSFYSNDENISSSCETVSTLSDNISNCGENIDNLSSTISSSESELRKIFENKKNINQIEKNNKKRSNTISCEKELIQIFQISKKRRNRYIYVEENKTPTPTKHYQMIRDNSDFIKNMLEEIF